MARILIADDEPEIFNIIKRYAEREGHEASHAPDGCRAVELCREHDYDLLIMDIMMPDMDGFEALRKIRELKDIPVLMLSALGSEYDKLYGFELGIDDYMVKPFSPRELMARAKVIIKRHRSQQTACDASANLPAKVTGREGLILAGDIAMDIPAHEVYINDRRIELTAKEFDILKYMMLNQHLVLSRERILDAVWGYEYCGEDRTVDWQIKLLRSKLGECRNYIRTVRGVGYRFEADLL